MSTEAGAGAAAGLALLARRRPAGTPTPASAALVLPLAIITVGFVLLIAVLDLWSPMSTPRNYIVLLPFLALLVGGACSLLNSALPVVRPLVLLAVFAFCLDAARESHRRLAGKARAGQDWKGASALMAAEAAGRHLYYIPAGNTQGSPLIAGIANHYLSTTSGGRLRAQEYRLGVTQPSRPALILFGHNAGEWSQLSSEMQRLGARQIFSGYDPTHFRAPGASVGVFLVP